MGHSQCCASCSLLHWCERSTCSQPMTAADTKQKTAEGALQTSKLTCGPEASWCSAEAQLMLD